MHNKNKKSGFTIVELLIVIVVIAILAAITIVAFNGVQGRARNSSRIADVRSIQKALELYRADNGVYSNTNATSMVNTPGCSLGVGYSYSVATDTSWMKPLVDNNYLTKVPVSPNNDCSHYYRYIHLLGTSYGCTRPFGLYILQVFGVEPGDTPADAVSFQPCVGAPNFTTTSTNWTFQKDES